MLRALRLPAVTSLALAATVFGAGAAGAAVSQNRPASCVKTVTKHAVSGGTEVSTVVACTIRGKHGVVIARSSAESVTSGSSDWSGTARSSVSSVVSAVRTALSWPR